MSDAPDILNEIVEVKRREVERLKIDRPVSTLEGMIDERRPPLNLGGALWGDSVRIIAEVKRASPSRGLLRPEFDAADLRRKWSRGRVGAHERRPFSGQH